MFTSSVTWDARVAAHPLEPRIYGPLFNAARRLADSFHAVLVHLCARPAACFSFSNRRLNYSEAIPLGAPMISSPELHCGDEIQITARSRPFHQKHKQMDAVLPTYMTDG